MNKIVFLGTGTSLGVPIIGCKCKVCLSDDTRDKRLRSSVAVFTAAGAIIIDAGPDFRQQVLACGDFSLRAVLITHAHRDHVGGLDDLRPFNHAQQGRAVDIYAENIAAAAIRADFSYAFAQPPYPGVPKLKLIEISTEQFTISGINIIPIRGMHGKLPVLGFRIGNFSYLSDMNHIPGTEMSKLQGTKILAIGALRHKSHHSHFSLQEALKVAESISPEKTFITHISHDLCQYSESAEYLPADTGLAFDGLEILCS
jgi:phosphoribosyl 1,2-cyclic phosphate phosphodiesterase